MQPTPRTDANAPHAPAPRTLSLTQLPIHEPCPADWAAMHGDDAKRFCDQCELHVHNLSAMTQADANTLIAEASATGGRLCVRYAVDGEGNIKTLADCSTDTPTGPTPTGPGHPTDNTVGGSWLARRAGRAWTSAVASLAVVGVAAAMALNGTGAGSAAAHPTGGTDTGDDGVDAAARPDAAQAGVFTRWWSSVQTAVEVAKAQRAPLIELQGAVAAPLMGEVMAPPAVEQPQVGPPRPEPQPMVMGGIRFVPDEPGKPPMHPPKP